MNNAVDAGKTDEEAVKAIYPDAYINDDYSGSPSADVGVFRKATKEDWPKNREVAISGFFPTSAQAWSDARSKLPSPSAAKVESETVFIDPRTKEPCRRCYGTGKMPPWPGSKGLVHCGICREEDV